MKKLLLIAYYYFQEESVASNRTRAIFDYLHEFGWEVKLITAPSLNNKEVYSNNIICAPDKSHLIKLYYKFTHKNSWGIIDNNSNLSDKKKRESSFFRSYCTRSLELMHDFIINNKYLNYLYDTINYIVSLTYFPDLYARWYKPALKAGLRELKLNQYDAILSTSGPFTAHKIANKLHKKTGIPWIADFRDLWSERPVTSISVSPKRINLEHKYELSIISSAEILTTVSLPLSESLVKMHNKKCEVVTNGFDPKKVNKNIPLRPKFTITHTGSTYDGKSNPEELFKAINELINEKVISRDNIVVEFYGPMDTVLSEKIKKYDLLDIVFQNGLVSKSKSLLLQSSSQILLLVTFDKPDAVGIYTGKIFEYLAARRPILSIGYKGWCVISDLLNETKSGYHPMSYIELKNIISIWYCEYLKNGMVSYNGITEKNDDYSYPSMAKKIAEILNSIVLLQK